MRTGNLPLFSSCRAMPMDSDPDMRYSANENTILQCKRTIMPADVFRALDNIEFGFMRERVEAEFNSAYFVFDLLTHSII